VHIKNLELRYIVFFRSAQVIELKSLYII